MDDCLVTLPLPSVAGKIPLRSVWASVRFDTCQILSLFSFCLRDMHAHPGKWMSVFVREEQVPWRLHGSHGNARQIGERVSFTCRRLAGGLHLNIARTSLPSSPASVAAVFIGPWIVFDLFRLRNLATHERRRRRGPSQEIVDLCCAIVCSSGLWRANFSVRLQRQVSYFFSIKCPPFVYLLVTL